MTEQTDTEKLTEEHWDFICHLLNTAEFVPDKLHEFLFKEAFTHGVKHGKETK